MIDPHKADMLAAVMEEFDLHTVAYIGRDEDFPAQLAQRIGDRKLESPGDNKADAVFLDEYPEDVAGAIKIAFSKTKEGGFLMGSNYLHKHLDVMNAVADLFNLMLVQVGPAGVWCIRK